MLARHPVEASAMASNARAPILVLEDDEAFRRFLVQALSGAGYSIVDTGNASEAMRLLNDKVAFDLLIADINMPGLQPHGVNVGNVALNQRLGPGHLHHRRPRAFAPWFRGHDQDADPRQADPERGAARDGKIGAGGRRIDARRRCAGQAAFPAVRRSSLCSAPWMPVARP
jgi:Response regulator receiver domain